jgi:hypothetical protein
VVDPLAGEEQPTPDLLHTPRRRPSLLERLRTPDSYGLVLVVIVISLLVEAVAPARSWAAILAFALRSGLLLFVLYTSQAHPRTVRAAAVAVAIGLVAAITDQTLGAAGVTHALEAVVVAAALGAIARRIGKYPRVNGRTIEGALAIYLLLAMLAASLFMTLDAVTAEPFFAQGGGTRPTFLYFSFVTLTTLGYGDLTPLGDLARMLAVVEALVGQLYLVTVVALIVGNLGQERRRLSHGRPGAAVEAEDGAPQSDGAQSDGAQSDGAR